jgi:hypothetical protein
MNTDYGIECPVQSSIHYVGTRMQYDPAEKKGR